MSEIELLREIASIRRELDRLKSFDVPADPRSGWMLTNETWTYASSTTFTVPGDKTARFVAGLKLRFTQTTVKYFYVRSSSYAAPNTTVTIAVNSDYSLANAVITSPAYSNHSIAEGFPAKFNWTPGFSGFSVNPTVAATYAINGNICTVQIEPSAGGTSNSTSFSFTGLPIASVGVCRSIAGYAIDNGIIQTGACRLAIANGATTIALLTDMGGGLWTASGSKSAYLFFYYQIR